MQRPAYASLWFYLLTHASVYGNEQFIFNGKQTSLKPGQLIIGIKRLGKNIGVPSKTVYRILQTFKNEKQIDIQTTNKYSIITILNWSKYQSGEEQNEKPVRNKRETNENNKEDKIERKNIYTSVSNETNDDTSSNELVYVSDLEVGKRSKRATAPKELPPFLLKAERDKLLNSTKRINHIVGLYLEVLGNSFPANSYIQFRTLLKRHYADAKHLVDFTDGQIKDAMAKCEKDSDMGNKWKWTLGTVLKYISK